MIITEYVMEIKATRVPCDPYFKSTQIRNYINSSKLLKVLNAYDLYYLVIQI